MFDFLIGNKASAEILKHLQTALYIRHTEASYHDSIDAAIHACRGDTKKNNYIRREWKATSAQWAMYARQHSSLPVLLQVRTNYIILRAGTIASSTVGSLR